MSSIPRVYTLGNSPLKNWISYKLAKLPSQTKIPNIILLLNDEKNLKRFLDNDSKLKLNGNEQMQFMAACEPPTYVNGRLAVIENLLVCETKKKSMTSMIQKYTASLSKSSNVLMINPPIGCIPYLYEKVWSDLKRPNLFIGLNPNYRKRIKKCYTDEFNVNETFEPHKFELLLTSVPREFASYRYSPLQHTLDNQLLALVKEISDIDAKIVPFGEFLVVRFEKLIEDSCIEPLALLYDCKFNKEILQLQQAKIMVRNLVNEQTKIILKAFPFIKELPFYKVAFDNDRLYNVVISTLQKSPFEQSKLIQDMNKLNYTDINQLTGYFVRLAYSMNMDCRWNETITWLVKGKVELMRRRKLDFRYL
ncbi:hypothetical protein KAFR_0B06200 [Kazachstania africana CBS 2517]|uniref:Ketopantoate reductase C-terminal domain-containing protein n=1 Tax=Kazachstania africana (strain ATCC 22294 / BCRC 22015 / CBS 2517 / CECT 1963 / NBRC 1671 / NRRL Y-8276) TaxID=1071382 RepID=H2ARB7_KAZAF|nr:hypothetical protein KAFR_0B06200 [Kazachstania africana CBS 2517]CCF56917.1 hypothetical protein KAFR_0B06200 [Kazachstania africana CBS 2517]